LPNAQVIEKFRFAFRVVESLTLPTTKLTVILLFILEDKAFS
jgi:hypothetical protein